MKDNVKITLILMPFVILSLLYGCAAKKEIVPAKPAKPAWVEQESGAFVVAGKQVFYGVGVADRIKSISLIRDAADADARAQIALQFKTCVSRLFKIYTASTSGGEAGLSSEEQHANTALQEFTNVTLSGVEIIDHYKDTETGAYYSLARMDFTAFRDSMNDFLNQDQQLSDKVRDSIVERADAAFDGMDREKAKQVHSE